MATVQLQSLGELKRAIRQLGVEMEKAQIKAMRDAARFGAAAVVRTSAKSRPRPKAAGIYERSWLVHRLKDGATTSNSAAHSLFVERGRLPGRRPPFNPIKEWAFQKRLAKRPKPPKGAKKTKATKDKGPEKAKGPKMPKKKRGKKKWAVLDVNAFVERVRWKIAKKGTPGRFVLRRTMPTIAKRAMRESKRQVSKLMARPPRGKGV